MPGLPLGAAQSHYVPEEMRSYDHIVGIQFIEIDPNLPYPRSAAYRKVPTGAQMLIRKSAPELFEIDLSIDEARAFIQRLRDTGLFEWQRVFKPVQGSFVDVATEWRIEVDFDQKIAKRSSMFRSEGEDGFPDDFDAVVEVLLSLAPKSEPEDADQVQSSESCDG